MIFLVLLLILRQKANELWTWNSCWTKNFEFFGPFVVTQITQKFDKTSQIPFQICLDSFPIMWDAPPRLRDGNLHVLKRDPMTPWAIKWVEGNWIWVYAASAKDTFTLTLQLQFSKIQRNSNWKILTEWQRHNCQMNDDFGIKNRQEKKTLKIVLLRL